MDNAAFAAFSGIAGLRDDETGDCVTVPFAEMTDGAQNAVISIYQEFVENGTVDRNALLQQDNDMRILVREDPNSTPEMIEYTHTRWLYLFETPHDDIPTAVYRHIAWTCELRFSEGRDTPPVRTIIGQGNNAAAAMAFASGVVHMMGEFAEFASQQGIDPDIQETNSPIMQGIARSFWQSEGLERPDDNIPYMMNMGGEVAKS